ncbi:MAG: NAD(P)/FAD-dependent oxidoreductase [Candidatus Latescibacteria bacterium]|jgi:digeranylgeranylglycerophospholipid reductase|nr:NAD(P)/FAD-dependent oxidoreductase [Candidatus Latescibacterota bacterium]
MKDQYDVVVVGAGPGGSMAAKSLADRGVSVLLLEKRQEIGAAVRCAEVVGPRDVISRFIPVDESWVYHDLDEVWLYPPNGKQLRKDFPQCGMMVDRKRFDKALAIAAANAGAEVRTKTQAMGLERVRDGVRLTVRHMGREHKIDARAIVGADGVESMVGRWAGMKTALGLTKVFSSVQYQLTGIDGPPNVLQFYFGNEIAPGGYLWVFPKAGGTANVGVCVSPSCQKDLKALDYLDRFVQDRFPYASSVEMVMGGIPIGGPLKTFVSDNVALVGDAAHQVNPLSAGGIVNAMEAGILAGGTIADGLASGDVSERSLRAYDRKWFEESGNLYRLHARLRRLYYKLSDDDLNRLGDTLENLVMDRSPNDLYSLDFAKSVVKTMAWMIPKFRFMR